ncbi:MAG: VTT domain-containing protein [Legionella sp.]|jgi:membrane-associated protein
MNQILDTLLHIDVYLNTFVTTYGFWTYFALFAVVFCETGLIVTPFLPGDSLLFAAGSIAAQTDNSLNILILFAVLFIASTLGNQINYLVGKMIGLRISNSKSSWAPNKKHIEDTHKFYEIYGGKTIIIARFIPIIRTFAPFVAGIGKMNVLHFSLYNIVSAVLWVGSLLSLGYFLGSIPIVKQNFTLAIYGIIALSLVPTIPVLLSKLYPKGKP